MAWLKICDAESIPRLGSTIVKKKDLEIGIFRNSNDEYFVFNDRLGLSTFYHKNNNFNFSMVSEKDIFSTSGTCETF